ncbi:hypothetical protein ACB092_04G195600 [Castanea dentata]
MFFPSVHLILVCKFECPKIMDAYEGEWGHCDYRYCLVSRPFIVVSWEPSWPGLLNYFLCILGAFNFLFSLFDSQPTINLFSKLKLGPWNQSVEQPIMYK